MIIAIAGATGLTGGFALERLLAHPQVQGVVALGRRSTGKLHPKLSEVSLDADAAEVRADGWICCLGTTLRKAGSREAFREIDLELPLRLARLLHRQGCARAAIVSAIGADAESPFFYNRVKGEMEKGMEQVGFTQLSLLRPSVILGQRPESRPLERFAGRALRIASPLLGGPLRHFAPVEADAIAKRLVQEITESVPGVHRVPSGEIR